MADVRSKLAEAAGFLDDMRRTSAIEGEDGSDFKRYLNGFLGAFQSTIYRMEYEAEQRGNVGDDRLIDWLVQELQRRGFLWKDKVVAKPSPPTHPRDWRWGSGKSKHQGSNATLELLGNQRHVDVHRRDIELGSHTDVGVADSASFSETVAIHLTRGDGTCELLFASDPGSQPPPSTGTIQWWRRSWFFTALPNTEVLSACETALASLTVLVDDYEALGYS